jgi:hypothetical protein
MRSALTLARQLDTPAQPLPLLPNPEVEQLMVAPYWGPECISTSEETNLMGAASLLAAAWCLTGGRRQFQAVVALLQEAGMTAAASRKLAEQARLTVGEPGHALVVGVLRARLESGIAAGL